MCGGIKKRVRVEKIKIGCFFDVLIELDILLVSNFACCLFVLLFNLLMIVVLRSGTYVRKIAGFVVTFSFNDSGQ